MSRHTLPDLLALAPVVWQQLGDSQHPGSKPTDGVRVSGGGGIASAPPVVLDVTEHRHKLLRGLRWWVDAVDATDAPGLLGDSPARMCAWLLHNLPHMAAEDRGELGGNLAEWLREAWPLVGDVEPPRRPLPVAVLDASVSQAVAAKTLGVSVSTVWRRAGRAGDVTLREVAGPVCEFGDLPELWCAHCVLNA